MEPRIPKYVPAVNVVLKFLTRRGIKAGPVNVIFTIDPSQSTESWSGTDNTYGAFTAQQPGSLSTSTSGNFVLSFDPTTDNSVASELTGRRCDQDALLAHRLLWALSDLAAFTARLRQPHERTADATRALHGIQAILAGTEPAPWG